MNGGSMIVLLGIIAIAGITAGVVLAISGYSSAGAFAVASACVGVLGTLAAQKNGNRTHKGALE